MMTIYKINWAHGQAEYHDTYEGAIAAVESVLSGAVIGHDGDISEGCERTLFWASEDDATNDAGVRAKGSIVALHDADEA
jgi:hypothetical protein